MGKCSYTAWHELKCPEPTWKGSEEYCIFHDPSLEKDIELFKQKLIEKLSKKDYEFRGYYFPKEVDFSYRGFEEDANFSEATFQNAEFEGATFQNANFNRATFQDANFSEATFQNASFSRATFQDAKFWKATFKNARFGEATFQNASFSRATFQEYATFWKATFQEYASFSRATFQEYANFSEATFQNAEFEGATFQNAEFEGATFQDANFNRATFQDANFMKATFQDANFEGATFQKYTYFWKATFQDANFNRATFQDADFMKATFQDADFMKATFQDANFNRATFQDADFREAVTERNLEFTPNQINKLDLRYAQFLFKGHITTDLTEARFHRADLENVAFTDCMWPEKIYEEIHMDDEGLTFKELETIYRNLKQSMQRHGDYSKAGDFYYREIECRKKAMREKRFSLNWFKSFGHSLLKYTCGYGENLKELLFHLF
ncbi:MAG: pentapeptide repeat-containing protein [Theionarchaea archaeon]|nr:pentapeptide repeat-containing protein [Theionarchaea archaeon]